VFRLSAFRKTRRTLSNHITGVGVMVSATRLIRMKHLSGNPVSGDLGLGIGSCRDERLLAESASLSIRYAHSRSKDHRRNGSCNGWPGELSGLRRGERARAGVALGRFFRLVEKSRPITVGLLFAVVGVIVAADLPSSSNKGVSAFLAVLVFHTAAMLIVGMGLQKAKRLLAVSWVVVLALFFVVAVIFGG